MSLFSYSRAFGLTVCGVTCGLISAMDLGESTDEADKTAGNNTLWGIFVLISLLLIYFMFTLKYNNLTASIVNFMYNGIPAGLSVVVGITVYFAYYFEQDASKSKYFISLVLLMLNLIFAYVVIDGLQNPPFNPEHQTVTSWSTKICLFLLLIFLMISSATNTSLQSVVEDNQDIHPKSKSMFKWINIISISIVCVVFGGLIIYMIHNAMSKPAGKEKKLLPQLASPPLASKRASPEFDQNSPEHYLS